MVIIKKNENEITAWKVEDAEVIFHYGKNIFYCWLCGLHYCEHVSQLRAYLIKREADKTVNAFCDCVDPHFDLVENCSKCGKPPYN